MHLKDLNKKQYAWLYLILFGLTNLWVISNGFLLCQYHPFFFVNQLDLSLNFLFLINLPHFLISNLPLQAAMDSAWIALNSILVLAVIKKSPSTRLLAFTCCIYNAVYGMMVCLFTTLSIHGFASWVIVPLIFAGLNKEDDYYFINLVRFAFLIIWVSTAVWKIRAGGIFNAEQMSAILFQQHVAYMYANHDTYSVFISWFINHPKISYLVYLAAFLFELIFIVGFFTKKWDKAIILLFFIFLLMDFVFMRINYIFWGVFIIPFFYFEGYPVHHKIAAQ